MSSTKKPLIPLKRIEGLILLIRGQKIILDADLASIYGVQTKVLAQAVKRNISRFPADFMFQLTKEEFQDLGSQSVTSSSWGGRRSCRLQSLSCSSPRVYSAARDQTASRFPLGSSR